MLKATQRLQTILHHVNPTATTSITNNPVAASEGKDSEPKSEYDLVIVGGGVVGSSFGAVLGKAGKRVLIVERDLSEPDRIVGELLQPGGVRKLRELGLINTLDGIDSTEIYGYSIFMDNERVRISYPKVEDIPQVGRAFHHGRFIMKLREAAMAQPTVKMIQGTVSALIENNGCVVGIKYRDAQSKTHNVYAPLTVICDGSGSMLRKKVTDADMNVPSHFVGVILDTADDIPFQNHGHVFLTPVCPVLAYPISSKETRVLVDFNGSKLPSVANGDMARHLKEVIAPYLPEQIQSYFIRAVDSGKIRSMPNRTIPGKAFRIDGAILLGDAFNCRHPLTGGGMTVGLSDVLIMRDVLLGVSDLRDKVALRKAINEFYTRRRPMAATINILANALYAVFVASADPSLPNMRRACFEYFKLGGIAVSGPIGLLSGLTPNPWVLLGHFFAVALFGVGKTLLPVPLPYKIARAIALLRTATLIVKPLIFQENLHKLVL